MAAFKPQPVPDPLPQPGGKAKSVSFDGMGMSPQATFGPPPGRFKQFYQNNKWYFWAIIAGVIIISTLAYFAFRDQTPEPTKDANVVVGIDAPESSQAGGEVIYKIQIDNNDASKLESMSLEVIYDDGMTYVSSVPPADNLSGSRFPVPDLSPGDNAVLMIKTTVSGNINEDKQFIARLHYKFSNFNSAFSKESVHTVRLVAADIVLDMTGPQKATSIQTANYDIYYRNDSEKDINGARIQVTYPNEFKYTSSNPSPSLGQNIWNLNNLAKNASGKISFSGNFKGARPGQSVIFKIEFLALDESGSYFTQGSTTYMTMIESQPLSAEIRLVNDAPNGVVRPGESLQYEVKFQNNTQVAATGLNVVVDLESPAIDTSTIRAESGLIEGKTLTWNAASVSQLERLNPNDSGTVRFSFQLKNPAVGDNSENIQVITKSRIKSNENPAFINGAEVILKIASPSSIERGVSVVSGPIPPTVGNSTTVQVSVSLRNGSNDYREAVLIGYIPLGVTLDKASISGSEAAAVKFDSATGKMTWTVGQLSAHSGASAPLRTLKFNTSFTPTANQVNQNIALLKNISFTAKDTFTEQPISLSAQEINTDSLPGDGSGRVRP